MMVYLKFFGHLKQLAFPIITPSPERIWTHLVFTLHNTWWIFKNDPFQCELFEINKSEQVPTSWTAWWEHGGEVAGGGEAIGLLLVSVRRRWRWKCAARWWRNLADVNKSCVLTEPVCLSPNVQCCIRTHTQTFTSCESPKTSGAGGGCGVSTLGCSPSSKAIVVCGEVPLFWNMSSWSHSHL